jgi:hypothetical protein
LVEKALGGSAHHRLGAADLDNGDGIDLDGDGIARLGRRLHVELAAAQAQLEVGLDDRLDEDARAEDHALTGVALAIGVLLGTLLARSDDDRLVWLRDLDAGQEDDEHDDDCDDDRGDNAEVRPRGLNLFEIHEGLSIKVRAA